MSSTPSTPRSVLVVGGGAAGNAATIEGRPLEIAVARAER
jgi:succinate dehydrogenase/fumarate reductase flavoprotein subunit